MKYLRRIASALLAILFILAICACTPSKKMQDKVYDYLDEKYKGLNFEVTDYTQDKETSGRYTVYVTCTTTDVDFEIYASSLYITDSYFVRWANSVMDPQIMDAIGDACELTYVSDVQWLDLYEENSNGYKFREQDGEVSGELKDVTEIYRIYLSDVPSANEAAQGIYMTVTLLNSAGVHLDKVTFDFQLEGEPILFSTDTDTITNTALIELEEMFQSADSSSTEGNILYQNSTKNTIEFFHSKLP